MEKKLDRLWSLLLTTQLYLSTRPAPFTRCLMEHRAASRASKLAPQTLGESAGITGSLNAALDPATRRWVVEWTGPSGDQLRTECGLGETIWGTPRPCSRSPGPAAPPQPSADLPAGVLACVHHEAGRVLLRSGRRITGVPPLFPSASLIFSTEEAGAWSDVAFADEVPEAEIGTVALAVAPDCWLAAYLIREENRSFCRTVRLPLHAPRPAGENWRKLPPYPQAPGMAGLMVAMHDGVLIAAGGANFPDQPPWEGGKKSFYSEIYVLLPGASAWIPAGQLPAPRAYGATVTAPDGVLIAGGESADQVYQDSLLLRWTGQRIEIISGPPLPAPATCAAAAVLDGKVYLAGGYGAGTPRVSRNFFWQLDLTVSNRHWQALPAWTGPTRALAVTAAIGGAFYVISGIEIGAIEGKEGSPNYLKDAFRYRPGQGWETLPDAPWSVLAAASPAPVSANPPRVFVLGGVDGRQVGKIPRSTQVPHDIIYFDVALSAWRHWPERWPNSVVCASAIESNGEWIMPSGEIMAGKRTTEVWAWRIVD